MTETENPAPITRWTSVVLFALAWGAALFYVMTAHLTEGRLKDFGCLWMAGRLIVIGEGRSLYDPETQVRVLRSELGESVARELQNEGLARLPYPPVQGLVYAPLGWFNPKSAQWLMVQLSVASVVMAAFLLRCATNGRVPMSLTVAVTILQPAFFCNIALGQNGAITLLIMCCGWYLWKRERYVMAGLVWGLLAYKPTWGLAVCWIPFVLRRPRAYAGMALSGMGLIVATLPFVGIASWQQWLDIGVRFERADVLKWNWIRRDLRILLEHVMGDPNPWMGWLLVVSVVAVTAHAAGRLRRHPRSRRSDALILSAIVLSCPRFMYYDLLLATPAILVAFFESTALARPHRWIPAVAVLAYCCGPVVGIGLWPWFWPFEIAGVLGIWCWLLVSSSQSIDPVPNSIEIQIG